MPTTAAIALAIIGGYLVGSISFAWLIGRSQGIDIRKHGSGNVGATNVQRVLGRNLGRLCFLLDFGKGVLPVVLTQALTGPQPAWIAVLAGAAAVVGHVWPITLGFKGGKGFATSLGVIAAVAPLCFVVGALVWLAVFFGTRYVSLASLASAVALPLAATAFRVLPVGRVPTSVYLLLWAVTVLIFIRHKSNIQRLLNGEEHRFGQTTVNQDNRRP